MDEEISDLNLKKKSLKAITGQATELNLSQYKTKIKQNST